MRRGISILILLGLIAVFMAIPWRPEREVRPTLTKEQAREEERSGLRPPTSKPARNQQPVTLGVETIVPPQQEPAVNVDQTRSPLLDRLNAADGSIEEDLRTVRSLFLNYFTVYKQAPVGTNKEMMKAFLGENPRGIRYVPDDHPSVNEKGELVDRWGTPFFFHQVAAQKIEIRSAGQDRIMWTEDDRFVD